MKDGISSRCLLSDTILSLKSSVNVTAILRPVLTLKLKLPPDTSRACEIYVVHYWCTRNEGALKCELNVTLSGGLTGLG